MSEQESHPEPVLKVSDRRHFTESGERRPGVEARAFEERTAAAAPAPPAAPPPAPAAAPPPPRQQRLAAREITLLGLLQDLYATCMMQLGAELQPGQPGQVDLEGARETIDLLGVLQQKTHGNLEAQESRLLEQALYELRLAYVEVMRASARVAPPPPPRR
ncbi:MAG TPA: DUF1844 domain-containing protein [Terriglobales bacterium]|nr:DUF1844 domain-containing protein [Terriglobales bacterium]